MPDSPSTATRASHMIRDRIKELRRVPARDLIPNQKNWRKHPKEQRAALRGVLNEIGFVGACLARELPDGSLELIDGHLRTETAGDAEIPVLIVDLDDAEAAKVLATLDPIAAMAEADAELLGSLMEDFEVEDDDLRTMLDDLASESGIKPDPAEIVEDEAPEPPAVPITKPGDLWILGNHRLLCGDSTKAEDVQRLMGGEQGVLMSTDPPYGVDFAGAKYNPRAKEWEGIANDKLQGSDLESFIAAMLAAWIPVMDERSSFYFWTAAMQEGAAAAAAVRAAGLHIQSQIIWNKNALVLGQADYQWKHENCWYAFWKGKRHRWYGGRKQTTVWEVKKVAQSAYVHPMQKPVELYAIPIENHTKKKEVVVEPFAGSGSQFMAAEQLDRRCFGIELSPAFCDVIVTRWEKLTGRKAELAK